MKTIDMHCHIVPQGLTDALRARTTPPMIERTADGSEQMIRFMGKTPVPRGSVEALLADMDAHDIAQAVLSNQLPDITNIAVEDALRCAAPTTTRWRLRARSIRTAFTPSQRSRLPIWRPRSPSSSAPWHCRASSAQSCRAMGSSPQSARPRSTRCSPVRIAAVRSCSCITG